MFCQKCGNEIHNEAVVCPHCGCPVQENAPQPAGVSDAPVVENGETSGMATGALVCAFLIPIVGIILGIVGVIKYETPTYKNRCIIAIVISIVVWIISSIIIFGSM